jgi:O-acetylserine/cysteine efflux transporter
LLVPIIGLASASVFLDERLSSAQYVGASLVMAGLVVNVFGGWVGRRVAALR